MPASADEFCLVLDEGRRAAPAARCPASSILRRSRQSMCPDRPEDRGLKPAPTARAPDERSPWGRPARPAVVFQAGPVYVAADARIGRRVATHIEPSGVRRANVGAGLAPARCGSTRRFRHERAAARTAPTWQPTARTRPAFARKRRYGSNDSAAAGRRPSTLSVERPVVAGCAVPGQNRSCHLAGGTEISLTTKGG